MGMYLNKGNDGFRESRNGEYVDKSGLIAVVNSTLFTERRFSCVSRCRRFGKSMAARMLAAYYDKSCDSRELFADLEISKDSTFERHLNKYSVIYLDLTDFVTRYRDNDIIKEMDAALLRDIGKAYPQVPQEEGDDLMEFLIRAASATADRFVFIIDEWDAICREFPSTSSLMARYVDWLRRMFKSTQANAVFAGVYMTGILPIKKYKTQSALNNFIEYSMIDPRRLACYFGFTKGEVEVLAKKYGMDIGELEKWYDGYQIGNEQSMFNPNSVMQALDSEWCTNYWNKSGTYEVIVPYITKNYAGLKDDVVSMLAGREIKVNPSKFGNDLSVIESKDDALTALVHLGYMSYNRQTDTCRVPNLEVMEELANAVEKTGWVHLAKALQQSEQLLQATLDSNEEAVAAGIDAAHDEHTSILSYNDENSLACVLSIAYYYAQNNYVIHREYPTGKGFADLVLIPRKHVDSPAVVVELKYDKTVESAISQIRQKCYPAKIAEYAGNLLLVGVSYDKKQKRHHCKIERA